MSKRTTGDDIREFYGTPAPMTLAGRHTDALKRLPDDIATLVRIVQGLVIHEFVTKPFYGVDLQPNRRAESHLRPVTRMLDRILELDGSPLTTTRPPEKRLVGVCRHFVVFLLAMLRAKGIPARCRAGFGTYFNAGYFEDHVVCEYWNAQAKRWQFVDPQFDDVWRKQLKIGHDIFDVPRDRFLVAGEGWRRCRAGQADAATFGIIDGNRRGLWFVASNVVRDLAELNKVETLQWDTWGIMPRPDQRISDEDLALFDDVSAMSHDPDASFDRLRQQYAEDERLRVPSTVFNAMLNRMESIDDVHSAMAWHR
jgi:hypothetical protein